MEGYGFKFSNKDLDRRWELFGSPKNILELCGKIEKDLLLEKKKFHEGQVANQEEFSQNIDALQIRIQNFTQYKNLNQHIEVSDQVKDVNKKLFQY